MTSYDNIYVGQRIRAGMEFRLNGVPTDPTIAQVLIRKPSGSTVTISFPDASFIRNGLGEYEVYYTVDESGTWVIRAVAAGVIDGVDEVSLVVQPSVF